jgi:poly(beta-D-mannuronate) lyase
MGLVIACAPMLALATEIPVKNQSEFAQAIRGCAAGDTIVLASGQWRDVDLLAETTGTSERPVVIQAEEPGKVVLTGNSRIRLAGEYISVSGLRFHQAWHKTALLEFRKDSKRAANHCRVSDCEFIDCTLPQDLKHDFKYVSIYGQHNLFERCRLSGKTNRGTTLVVWLDNEGGQHIIRNNHFGPRPELEKNGGETIRIGDSGTAEQDANCLVEQNLFVECNGEAEIVSNKSCQNTYQHNVFLRCSGTLTLRHGHRCTVQANLFLGQKAGGSGGVRIIGSDHVVINNRFERLEGDDYRCAMCLMNGLEDGPDNGYQPVQRARIAHNTFIDCKRTIVVGADNDEKVQVAPVDCQFVNNAIMSRRGPLIDIQNPQSELQWSGNLWHGEGKLGVDNLPGIHKAASELLKKNGERWALFESSPLVDSGELTKEALANDFAGSNRDQTPDVGCDEWPLATESWLDHTEVGPSWSAIPLNPDSD